MVSALGSPLPGGTLSFHPDRVGDMQTILIATSYNSLVLASERPSFESKLLRISQLKKPTSV